jgi:hypothetical protein
MGVRRFLLLILVLTLCGCGPAVPSPAPAAADTVLPVGTGHGILYKTLDEWFLPAIEWVNSGQDP